MANKPASTRELVQELWNQVEGLSKELDIPAVSFIRGDRQALVDIPLRGEDCLDPHEVELLLAADDRARCDPRYEACVDHLVSCPTCQELMSVATPSPEELERFMSELETFAGLSEQPAASSDSFVGNEARLRRATSEPA